MCLGACAVGLEQEEEPLEKFNFKKVVKGVGKVIKVGKKVWDVYKKVRPFIPLEEADGEHLEFNIKKVINTGKKIIDTGKKVYDIYQKVRPMIPLE
jgi:hypothetical protein